MTQIKKAVDMSKWGGPLTDAEARCFKDSGWQRVVVGISEVPLARQQLTTARAAGLETHGYVYVYWPTAAYFPEFAINNCGDLIDFLWIDVEQETELSPAAVVHLIHQCVAVCEAKRMPCGIYTSLSKWQTLTGNSQEFKDLPLWNAFYDDDPDMDFARNPYGGWTHASMEQYGNTQSVCGQSVDVNVYQEEEVDAPTKAEFAALFKLVIDTRDAVIGVAKFVLNDKSADDAAEAELRARVEALEADK